MELKGIAASGGIGIGTAAVIREELPAFPETAEDSSVERERLNAAIETFMADTARMAEELRVRVGQKESEILTGQILMIQDPDMRDEMDGLLDEGKSAEAALDETCREFSGMLASLDDDLMRQRATDVDDMRRRILSQMLGVPQVNLQCLPDNTVLVARELTPSMTVGLRAEAVSAIVTQSGGFTSHSAILSRALGIPAVLSVPGLLETVKDGETLVVDGSAGTAVVSPTEQELAEARKQFAAEQEKKRLLALYKDKPTEDAEGNRYAIYANIGKPADAKAAAEAGAEGVGLFRTEFLFMDRTQAPSEEEQFAAYCAAAEALPGKEIIVRTLDIGGDKGVDYLQIEKEENPFLGNRAIRYCLGHPDLYKTQLRALLRAGALWEGIRIMIPMVTGPEEVERVKALLEECKAELHAEGKPCNDNIAVGIMVETPAAVMLADDLAKVSDFFSIGTNDLTMYTLAVDRGNAAIASMYRTGHKAVLRAIHRTIRAAKDAGIPVGMCGEAAADPAMIPYLMAWGLDEFSVSSSAVLRTRAAIAGLSRSEAERQAEEAIL